MKKNIINELKNLTNEKAEKVIFKLVKKSKLITNEELNVILNSGDFVVNIFIDNYVKLTPEQFSIIENYINKNLDHENRLFVSDLIEFSTDFGLNLNYLQVCNLILDVSENNHFVVLASVEYIYQNYKLSFISQTFAVLDQIIDNPYYYENVQCSALFALYRITGKLKYVKRIKTLLKDSKENQTYVSNKLKKLHNKEKYFRSKYFKKTLGIN